MRTLLGGLRPWFIQRVSAVYLLVFLVVIIGRIVLDPPGSFVGWRDWVASASVRTGFYLFLAAFVAHVWVGLRDVILDYGKPRWVRIVLLVLIVGALIIVASWVLRALFML